MLHLVMFEMMESEFHSRHPARGFTARLEGDAAAPQLSIPTFQNRLIFQCSPIRLQLYHSFLLDFLLQTEGH